MKGLLARIRGPEVEYMQKPNLNQQEEHLLRLLEKYYSKNRRQQEYFRIMNEMGIKSTGQFERLVNTLKLYGACEVSEATRLDESLVWISPTGIHLLRQIDEPPDLVHKRIDAARRNRFLAPVLAASDLLGPFVGLVGGIVGVIGGILGIIALIRGC